MCCSHARAPSAGQARIDEPGPRRGAEPDQGLPVDDRTDAAAGLSLPADLLAIRVRRDRTIRRLQGWLADAQAPGAMSAIRWPRIRPSPVNGYAILQCTLRLLTEPVEP